MTTPTVTAAPNTVIYVCTESMPLDTDGIDLQLLGCTVTTVDVSGTLSATACVGNTTPFTPSLSQEDNSKHAAMSGWCIY